MVTVPLGRVLMHCVSIVLASILHGGYYAISVFERCVKMRNFVIDDNVTDPLLLNVFINQHVIT